MLSLFVPNKLIKLSGLDCNFKTLTNFWIWKNILMLIHVCKLLWNHHTVLLKSFFGWWNFNKTSTATLLFHRITVALRCTAVIQCKDITDLKLIIWNMQHSYTMLPFPTSITILPSRPNFSHWKKSPHFFYTSRI